jgi:hypothetical protein
MVRSCALRWVWHWSCAASTGSQPSLTVALCPSRCCLQPVVVRSAGIHWSIHAACCLHGQQGLFGGYHEEHPRSYHCESEFRAFLLVFRLCGMTSGQLVACDSNAYVLGSGRRRRQLPCTHDSATAKGAFRFLTYVNGMTVGHNDIVAKVHAAWIYLLLLQLCL